MLLKSANFFYNHKIRAIVRKWHCYDDNYCNPVVYDEQQICNNLSLHETQELCRLVCGNYRGLWPQPYNIIELSHSYVPININKIRLEKKISFFN